MTCLALPKTAQEEDAFPTFIRKSPAFLRNVCVALGNVGTSEDIPALELAAQDPHPLISEHAAWAFREARGRSAP